MTIKDLTTTYFNEPNITSLEVGLILAHVLRKSREFILIHPEFKIDKRQAERIADLIERRVAGEPMAYLLGYQEFYSLKFLTTNSTLIPRPETEMLVEEVIHITRNTQHVTPPQIIDVGTGSGCIAISLAHELGQELKTANRKIIAIDIEAKAIKLARKNAHLNKVKDLIEFKVGNLLEPVLKECYVLPALPAGRRDMCYVICANLPYLTPDQVKNSPTIQHEPKTALVSGEDGLQHYRELFRQCKKIKAESITLLCEIDDTQGASMSELIKKELPTANFSIKKDLGGYDRLAVISLESKV